MLSPEDPAPSVVRRTSRRFGARSCCFGLLLTLLLLIAAIPSGAASPRRFEPPRSARARSTEAAQLRAAAGKGRSSTELVAHDGVVALLNRRGFSCSGVLVHQRGVLTARHCLDASVVVFGARVDRSVDTRQVARRVGVPNRAIDLGLLILETEAPVKPYAIGTPRAAPGAVRVVGFGCTDAHCQDGAGRRSYFDARVRPEEWNCGPEAAARTGCLAGHEMVLGRSQAADTCIGDSGGAVLRQTKQGWQLIAVTSRAVADSVLTCGDGGVYVRLEAHRNWLERELGEL